MQSASIAGLLNGTSNAQSPVGATTAGSTSAGLYSNAYAAAAVAAAAAQQPTALLTVAKVRTLLFRLESGTFFR